MEGVRPFQDVAGIGVPLGFLSSRLAGVTRAPAPFSNAIRVLDWLTGTSLVSLVFHCLRLCSASLTRALSVLWAGKGASLPIVLFIADNKPKECSLDVRSNVASGEQGEARER